MVEYLVRAIPVGRTAAASKRRDGGRLSTAGGCRRREAVDGRRRVDGGKPRVTGR
jgi:hypothetical protein